MNQYVHHEITLDNGVKIDEYHKSQLPLLIGLTAIIGAIACMLARAIRK